MQLISTDDTSIPVKKTTQKPTEIPQIITSARAPKKIESSDPQLQNRFNIEEITAEKTTMKPTTVKPTEIPKKVDSVDAQLQNLLKQYDTKGLKIEEITTKKTTMKPTTARVVTEATFGTTTQGRSSDAILAQLLREQGIRPSTPRITAFEQLQSGVSNKAFWSRS